MLILVGFMPCYWEDNNTSHRKYEWYLARAKVTKWSEFQNIYILQPSDSKMAPKPKLTESSEAVIFIRKKFLKKGMLPTDNSKDVWESKPAFMVHNLDSFCTKFNRLKTEELDENCKNYFLFYRNIKSLQRYVDIGVSCHLVLFLYNKKLVLNLVSWRLRMKQKKSESCCWR